MIPRRTLCLPGILLLALSALPAQGPAKIIPEPLGAAFANKFLEAWMAETLLGDLEEARKLYKQTANDKNLPNHQVELALLRLWESSFDREERRRYAMELRKRNVFQSGGYRSRRMGEISRQMRKALEAKDSDAVVKLRQELREFLKKNPGYRTTRSIVNEGLRNRRGEQTKDPELEKLEKEHKAALEQRDQRKASRIAYRIRAHKWSKSPLASRGRLWAKRWADMTRLHLEGKHDRAARMEKLLRTQFRRRSRNSDPAALIARVQKLDPSALHKEFDKLKAELKKTIGIRVYPEEREVLTKLAERVDAMGKSGRIQEAVLLAVRTPYRTILFRTR